MHCSINGNDSTVIYSHIPVAQTIIIPQVIVFIIGKAVGLEPVDIFIFGQPCQVIGFAGIIIDKNIQVLLLQLLDFLVFE